MKECSDIGIIVKITPYQEDDALVDIFFENHGMLSLVAKGITKPTSKNKGLCRIGSLVGVEFFSASENASLGKLKKFTPVCSFLSDNYISQCLVMLIAELMQMYLPKGHTEKKVIILYQSYLQHNTFTPASSLCFLVSFFTILGMFPHFSDGKRLVHQKKIYWHEHSGIIETHTACDESSAYMLSLSVVKMLYHLSSGNFFLSEKINALPEEWKEAWGAIWWFHRLHCTWYPKSKKIIESFGIL